MVFQLVYSSAATQDFWPQDIFELVEKARLRNGASDITGMLLYHDGHFLQLLEGPEEAVRSCFARVARDPRHTSVKVVTTGTCKERDFPNWTMGLERIEDAWNLPRAWSTIFEEGLSVTPTAESSSAVKDLLLSFRHEVGSR